jgi:hypothetical protein
MKRIILVIAVLGILCFLSAPVMAGGGVYPNIVKVNQYYHGGHHPGYPGGRCDGWYGYRVYTPPPPPVWGYPVIASTMFPPHPPMFPQAVYRPYYRYYPRVGFYYSTPDFSVGLGY